MKLIVGLGNPGRAYERTRHNVGWWVVDHLADVWHLGAWREDAQALVASGRLGAAHVRLLKPLTFMNLSGAALVPYLRRPTFDPATDLLVVVDDVALSVGRIRLRAQGSAGGHNGLKSIELEIGGREYARLRVGVRPVDPDRPIGELADFVLSPFGSADRDVVVSLYPQLTAAIETWVHDGIAAAQNRFNADATA
ncbi:MAG TPA: aminoacyl-tRNA hydrolase [Gemmatimonadaceae bacterium]|jgi:PTH1 family peptidyl-tRNA hydrolase|nr:aminoacyl-tRNA hydrolase [Gemmatimonadaceae bacterium]